MKILFLSPQPFYQERGTAIAIDLLLKSLSDRGDEVDLLTFHDGEDRSYPNVRISRIQPYPAPDAIKPGFSIKKVYCDLFLFRDAIRMLRKDRYDLIHAVEESSFLAMVLGRFFRVPYVFDMDSSMATQMLDRFSWMGIFGGLVRWLETLPMRRAIAVVPMCEDLAIYARQYCEGVVHVLRDVSLLADKATDTTEGLRSELSINGPMLMYVGNLEEYQGIDLLLESFAALTDAHANAELVIIGGSDKDIDKYRSKASALGIDSRVHLVGPRPVAALGDYLAQSDLLVSPRVHGTNTPMKVYSYLDSGVAVLATALPTHTQVMTESEAALVTPDASAMAAKIAELLDDDEQRRQLAENAKSLIRRDHSWEAFRNSVFDLYSELESRIDKNS